MKFQSHVPSYVDADPAIPKRNFFSLEELLNHPWIKKWNSPKYQDFKYYWTENKGQWSKACLMAMWKEKGKYTWWVLGYMDEIPTSLPEWSKPDESKN